MAFVRYIAHKAHAYAIVYARIDTTMPITRSAALTTKIGALLQGLYVQTCCATGIFTERRVA